MEHPDVKEEEGADAVALAQLFHETYERLAPLHQYTTRKESAVAWADVPATNRNLMIAVCAEIIERQGWRQEEIQRQRADSLEHKLIAAIKEKSVVEEHLRQAYEVIYALNGQLALSW